MYKDDDGKNVRVSTGKKSEGITEAFTSQLRNETLNKQRNGIDPLAHKKKKSKVTFVEIWKYYLDNKSMSKSRKMDFEGKWKNHLQERFYDTVTLEGLLAFRRETLHL